MKSGRLKETIVIMTDTKVGNTIRNAGSEMDRYWFENLLNNEQHFQVEHIIKRWIEIQSKIRWKQSWKIRNSRNGKIIKKGLEWILESDRHLGTDINYKIKMDEKLPRKWWEKSNRKLFVNW